MKNIFTKQVTDDFITRINKLTPHTKPQWGKMNVSQMLAHCNVTYELIYDNKHKKPGGFMRFILKMLVKPTVVNEKAYKRDSQTGPDFVIKGERDFDVEKNRLISYLRKTQELGEKSFEGKDSHSFGK